MGPSVETRVTPCLLTDLIGNTSMTTGSYTEELPTLVPKGTRRVSAHLSPSRNTLSVQRAKTWNAEVTSIGRNSSNRASPTSDASLVSFSFQVGPPTWYLAT